MVTLNDYVPQDAGFIGGQAEGQAELLKAMQAGQITGRDTVNQPLGYEPLKVESLEKTLKNLETRTKDIKLFNAIPKMTSYNTVEEYLQLISYGNQNGGFYNEGELPDVVDSTYMRRAEHIKYLQVAGEVTLQAQIVRSFVDAMTQETKNKMMWLTRLANKTLCSGDADVIPQQFNGLGKQHASVGSGNGFLYSTWDAYYKSPSVVDLRGKSLKQSDVEDGAVQVDSQFGNVDTLVAPTTVISALTKDYYNQQRILRGGQDHSGFVGIGALKGIDTSLGTVNLLADKFIAKGAPKQTTTPADSSKAPVAAASLAAALATDAASKFVSGDAGNVFYAVAAINRFGESALTVYNTAVALAAGKSVDLTITDGTGAISADGYVVYRSKVTQNANATGLDFHPIFKVSKAQIAAGHDGASANVVRDRGMFLPDTEEAFVMEMSDEILSLKQLAPISKLDLATISMSRRFVIFMFCALALYAPKKVVRYINVGKHYSA